MSGWRGLEGRPDKKSHYHRIHLVSWFIRVSAVWRTILHLYPEVQKSKNISPFFRFGLLYFLYAAFAHSVYWGELRDIFVALVIALLMWHVGTVGPNLGEPNLISNISEKVPRGSLLYGCAFYDSKLYFNT